MISRFACMTSVLVCLAGYACAGTIEICKDSDPAGSLSGLYSFTIDGQPGTIMVPVGACTMPFVLPDGYAYITELGDPGSFLEIVLTFPDDRLISFDPQLGTATVLIEPGDLSDPSTETLVDFINAPAAVPEPNTLWAVLPASLLLGFWMYLRNHPTALRSAAIRGASSRSLGAGLR